MCRIVCSTAVRGGGRPHGFGGVMKRWWAGREDEARGIMREMGLLFDEARMSYMFTLPCAPLHFTLIYSSSFYRKDSDIDGTVDFETRSSVILAVTGVRHDSIIRISFLYLILLL